MIQRANTFRSFALLKTGQIEAGKMTYRKIDPNEYNLFSYEYDNLFYSALKYFISNENKIKLKGEQKAKELLDRFGLKNRFNNLPSQLSGGEQQRVAIARAIAMKPQLILADEPTGNLDSENSVMISNILFKYVKEEGSSLIMVTHDPKLANKAKRKIKIKDGKIA